MPMRLNENTRISVKYDHGVIPVGDVNIAQIVIHDTAATEQNKKGGGGGAKRLTDTIFELQLRASSARQQYL